MKSNFFARFCLIIFEISAMVSFNSCGPVEPASSNLEQATIPPIISELIKELLGQIGVPTGPWGALLMLSGDESPTQRERRERLARENDYDDAGADIPKEMRPDAGGIALTASLKSQKHFFKSGADSKLWHMFSGPSGDWEHWEDLGGEISPGPASVMTKSGEIHVFARGLNGALYHKWYSGSWSGWEDLGRSFDDTPSVVVTDRGKFLVTVKNSAHDVWYRSYDGGWSGWSQLGNGYKIISLPKVVNSGANQATLLGVGTNSELYSWTFNFNTRSFGTHTNHGGVIAPNVSATVQLDSPSADDVYRIAIAAKGRDNHSIYALFWSKSSGWSGWQEVGRGAIGYPSISANDGQIDIVAKRMDYEAMHFWSRDGGASFSSESLGGYLGSDPGAGWFVGGSSFEVIALGGDAKTLWRRRYLNGWSGWGSLGTR